MNKYFLIIVIALGIFSLFLRGYIVIEPIHQASVIFTDRNKLDEEREFFQDLLGALVDAETGERGFIITGDDKFLEPYDHALHLLNDPKNKDFLREEGKKSLMVAHLSTLINEKLAFIRKLVELRRLQGFEAAQKAVEEGSGKTTMDKIRGITKEVLAEKNQSLVIREEDIRDQLGRLVQSANIGNVVTFLFMGSCLVALFLYANRLDKERKNLLDLEKLRDEILANSREIVLTLDPNGRVTSFNKMIERVTGYIPSQIIGAPFSQFIAPEDDKINLKNFSKKYSKEFRTFSDLLLFAKNQSVEEDVVWTFRNSARFYFQFSISPLKDMEGNFSGYLLEANEISERVKLNEKLIQARAEAENAYRVKSQFLSSMSHDLRTPLTAIIGYTDILQHNVEDNLNDKQFTHLKKIEENSLHLLEMIQDIMTLEKLEARKETVQLSEVRVGNLIEQIFHEVEIKAAKKGITLKVEGLEGSEPLHTDEQKLYRILMNLIANGVKFTNEGSVRVVVTQDKQTHQPIRIDVIDTGIGIKPIHQKKIFQPFFQVDRAAEKEDEGTGLGLSICKSYCQLLGYYISFKTEFGKGSTFTLDLT